MPDDSGKIPRDKRHNTKVDYGSLKELLKSR